MLTLVASSCAEETDTPTPTTTTSAPVFDASEIGSADVDPARLRQSLGQVVDQSKIANVGLDNGNLLTISGPLTPTEARALCEALDEAVYAEPKNADLTVEISADGGPNDGLLFSRAGSAAQCIAAP
jgi:hypothetical protein